MRQGGIVCLFSSEGFADWVLAMCVNEISVIEEMECNLVNEFNVRENRTQ